MINIHEEKDGRNVVGYNVSLDGRILICLEHKEEALILARELLKQVAELDTLDFDEIQKYWH